MSNIPTIGRIVHYRPFDKEPIVPAIITHVASAVPPDVDNQQYVNLTYFPDGQAPGTAAFIPYHDGAPDDLPTCSWMWPPRVGLRPG